MPTVTNLPVSISEGMGSLEFVLSRDLNGPGECPITLSIDGDRLGLTLDQAAKLAMAGRKIEAALASKEPKAAVVFEYKIGFPSGEISSFEIAVEIDPLAVAVTWHGKRITLPADRTFELLQLVLGGIGAAVDHIRGASRSSLNSIPTLPAPGRHWETWTPRFDVDAWQPEGWT